MILRLFDIKLNIGNGFTKMHPDSNLETTCLNAHLDKEGARVEKVPLQLWLILCCIDVKIVNTESQHQSMGNRRLRSAAQLGN